MSTRLLRSVCRALIGVVLLAQLAVSAYACPGVSSAAGMRMASGAGAGAVAVATSNPMPDCEGMTAAMDPAFAALCAEHCHHGQQSDHAATLAVPAPMLTALYQTPPAPEPGVAPRPAAASTSALAAAFPPHAILHCCFRI